MRIPIRLRVDPGALSGRQGDLAEALAAAAGRALRNSRAVVLEHRGGYAGINLHRPTFSWGGEAVGRLDDATRRELEALVEDVVRRAADEAGVLHQARAAERLPLPFTATSGEPLDPSRYFAVLGLYAIPSYDKLGKPKAVPVKKSSKGDEGQPQYVESFLRVDDAHIGAAVKEGFERLRRGAPPSGYIGVILRQPNGFMRYPVWDITNKRYFNIHAVGPLIEQKPELVGDKIRIVSSEVNLPPTGRYRLRVIRKIVDPSHLADAILAVEGAAYEKQVREAAQPTREIQSQAEFDKHVEEAVRAAVAMRAKGLSKDTNLILELTRDGSRVSLAFLRDPGRTIPEDLDTELVPLTELVLAETSDKDDAKEGGEAKAPGEGKGGAGKDAGEGDGARGVMGDGDGDGEGDARRRGGFVRIGKEYTRKGAGYFPSVPGSGRFVQTCEPLRGEPSMSELGTAGDDLRGLMTEIAFRLQIDPCEYAAHFCVTAARAIDMRAKIIAAVGSAAPVYTANVPTQSGNLGEVQFEPTASPSIQFLRHLAGVVPMIRDLSVRTDKALARQPSRIRGYYQGNAGAWSLLAFHEELTPALIEAAGTIFMASCQVYLLQLLRSSRESILTRIIHFDTFAALFEETILAQLYAIEELTELRDQLKVWLPGESHSSGIGETIYTTWKEARQGVLDAFHSRNPLASKTIGKGGVIVFGQGGTIAIQDSSGRVWSLRELELSISLRRNTVEQIDPLVKQIVDLPGVTSRFKRDKEAIRVELLELLLEMQSKNEEITESAAGSHMYAFRASMISPDLPKGAVPGSRYGLQGIHLQAHQQMGEFFRGDPHYGLAINALFGRELMYQSIMGFLEFTELVLLAVICPEAALYSGIAYAGYHYKEARAREDLYEALYDPELVLTRAEVEAGLFAAELGVALAFIPVGKELSVAARSVARRGLVEGAELYGRYAAIQASRALAEKLKDGLVQAIIKEYAQASAINYVLEKALTGPAMEALQKELAITGPSPSGPPGEENP